MTIVTNQSGLQNLTAAFSAGRPMGTRQQAVTDIISYTVDYSSWLAPGELLTNIAYVVSSTNATLLAVSSLALNGTSTGIVFQLSGGVANARYQIEFVATTNTGQVKTDFLYISVLAAATVTTTTPTPLPSPTSAIFVSQVKAALSAGYPTLSISANSANLIQLQISTDPDDPAGRQWYSQLYIQSGDPVWDVIKTYFNLTSAQADQFLTFAASFPV